jgi:hypothetical protein
VAFGQNKPAEERKGPPPVKPPEKFTGKVVAIDPVTDEHTIRLYGTRVEAKRGGGLSSTSAGSFYVDDIRVQVEEIDYTTPYAYLEAFNVHYDVKVRLSPQTKLAPMARSPRDFIPANSKPKDFTAKDLIEGQIVQLSWREFRDGLPVATGGLYRPFPGPAVRKLDLAKNAAVPSRR